MIRRENIQGAFQDASGAVRFKMRREFVQEARDRSGYNGGCERGRGFKTRRENSQDTTRDEVRKYSGYNS